MDNLAGSGYMAKRMIIVIIALVVVFGLIFGFDIWRAHFIKMKKATFQPPPTSVSTETVSTSTWHPTLIGTGSLTAINGVNVSSEVSGMVIALHFKSGELVQKGQSLVQLDNSTDVQQLKSNQAELNLDKVDFERKEKLVKSGAISASDYDQALAKLKQSRSNVNSSLVAIAQKNVRAPFSGKIGIREVNLGQYVKPGDSLVSLQSLNPLFVDFTLPEQNLTSLYLGQSFSIAVDAYPGKKFYGKVTAINALVTEASRSIDVQGTIPNPDYKLYPGSFADVTVYLPEKKKVLTVVQTAVTYSLFGDTAFVVEQKGKDKDGKPILTLSQRYVKIGDMKGNLIAIKEGLKAGEVVVTSGQNRLQNGMRVFINNSVKLKTPSEKKLATD